MALRASRRTRKTLIKHLNLKTTSWSFVCFLVEAICTQRTTGSQLTKTDSTRRRPGVVIGLKRSRRAAEAAVAEALYRGWRCRLISFTRDLCLTVKTKQKAKTVEPEFFFFQRGVLKRQSLVFFVEEPSYTPRKQKPGFQACCSLQGLGSEGAFLVKALKKIELGLVFLTFEKGKWKKKSWENESCSDVGLVSIWVSFGDVFWFL